MKIIKVVNVVLTHEAVHVVEPRLEASERAEMVHVMSGSARIEPEKRRLNAPLKIIYMGNVALPHSLEEAMECEGEVIAHVHLQCFGCGKLRPCSPCLKCDENGDSGKRRPHLVRHQLCDQEPHPVGERMCGEDPRDDL